MSQTPEWPPTAEAMHSLLPAFEFTSMVTANDQGAVFFANQKSLDRQVAVKVFSPALASDPTFLNAFDNSSKLASGLRNTNLIGILDSGRADSLPYLVMEFVPGKSLARSTRGQVVEFAQSLSIIDAICAGLIHAHEAGLVHGHLDTLSILLNQQAVPKIGNFGLGRAVHTDPDVKTPRHLTAPEVLVDPISAIKASDVFSVAAIFHELITGQRYSPASAPASTLCKCRPAIDAVLKRATDPDPGKRFEDARAFQEALKKAVEPLKKAAAPPKKAATPLKKAAAPLKNAADPPPSTPALLPIPDSGGGSEFVMKAVIIVVLLFAILFTWETLKKTRADRELENLRIIQREKDRKEERAAARAAANKAIEDARRFRNPSVPTPNPPRYEKEPETPRGSLSRLRSALASGSRSEMPVGSVKKGDRHYFLVEEAMSWADAAQFAEEHGAHLADPSADLGWLNAELTKGRECWLGAARGGGDSWVLSLGKPWSPATQLDGRGLFLITAQSGGFASADESQRRPFVIEWHADGSNPGSLAKLLAATHASLGGASPVFPPGTVVSGDRRYLYVPRPVTWNEAGKLAEAGGGHLVVAASTEEIETLMKLTGSLKARDGIWLGGSLEDDHWRWITGEPWQAAAWADESAASKRGTALAIRPGKGWIAMDRGDTASGLLIEWSGDKDSNQPGTTAPAPGSQIAELDSRVKELVLAAAKKRDEEFAANIKKFQLDLDTFLRNLNRGNQDTFGPSVSYLKEAVEDDRLLLEQIKEKWGSRRITVSPEMEKLLSYHYGKETQLDAKFLTDTGKIRNAYTVRLSTLRDEAKAAGQAKLAADTDDAIGQAKDLERWLKSLGVKLP